MAGSASYSCTYYLVFFYVKKSAGKNGQKCSRPHSKTNVRRKSNCGTKPAPRKHHGSITVVRSQPCGAFIAAASRMPELSPVRKRKSPWPSAGASRAHQQPRPTVAAVCPYDLHRWYAPAPPSSRLARVQTKRSAAGPASPPPLPTEQVATMSPGLSRGAHQGRALGVRSSSWALWTFPIAGRCAGAATRRSTAAKHAKSSTGKGAGTSWRARRRWRAASAWTTTARRYPSSAAAGAGKRLGARTWRAGLRMRSTRARATTKAGSCARSVSSTTRARCSLAWRKPCCRACNTGQSRTSTACVRRTI